MKRLLVVICVLLIVAALAYARAPKRITRGQEQLSRWTKTTSLSRKGKMTNGNWPTTRTRRKRVT